MILPHASVSGWSRLLFSIELWFAARALPFLVWRRNFGEVLQLAAAKPSALYLGISPAYVERKIRKTVRGPLFMRDRRCLRIGLLGYRFLCKVGYQPELHFGLEPDSVADSRIDAHCWVCLDARPVIGEPAAGMLTIHVHRADNDRLNDVSADDLGDNLA